MTGGGLQVLAEGPAHQDGHGKRHGSRRGADENQEGLVTCDRMAEDLRRRHVNALGASGQPRAFTNENDGDALKDERHHCQVVAAEARSGKGDDPAGRTAGQNRKHQCGKIGHVQVDDGER